MKICLIHKFSLKKKKLVSNRYNGIESSFDTSKTETVLNSNNNNTLLNKK